MFWYELLLVALVLALDLGSKYGIVAALKVEDGIQTGDDITFIKNFISFGYSENTGASWGSFQGKTGALTAITAVGLALLVVYLIFNKKESKFLRTCLVLILAGGLGNLYDRIVFGYVRDFIVFDFMNFPVFNVADSFLTVATILVVIYALFFMPKQIMAEQRKKKEEDALMPAAYPYNALTGETQRSEEEINDNAKV